MAGHETSSEWIKHEAQNVRIAVKALKQSEFCEEVFGVQFTSEGFLYSKLLTTLETMNRAKTYRFPYVTGMSRSDVIPLLIKALRKFLLVSGQVIININKNSQGKVNGNEARSAQLHPHDKSARNTQYGTENVSETEPKENNAYWKSKYLALQNEIRLEEEIAYWKSKYHALQNEIRLREETAALRSQNPTRASTNLDTRADINTGAVTERVVLKRLKTSATGATTTATDNPILSSFDRPFTLPADRTSRVSKVRAAPASPTSRLPSASRFYPPATQVAADSTRATKPSIPTVPPSGTTSSSIAAKRIKTEVTDLQDGQDVEKVEDSNKIRDRKRRNGYFGVPTLKNEDPVKHEDDDTEDELSWFHCQGRRCNKLCHKCFGCPNLG